MKVAFDISALGIGHRHASGRTGIFRTVERLARGLVASPECDVTFVAGASFETLRDCRDYIRTQPVEYRAQLAHPPFLGLQVRLEHMLRSSNLHRDRDRGVSIPRQVAERFSTKAAAAARGLLGGSAGSVDRRAISSADIYHSPEFPLYPSEGSVRRVLTCYDLIPIKYPEFGLTSHRKFAKEILDSIRPSDWVICISDSVRNDLCEYLGFDPQRTSVTYLAADPVLFHRVSDEGAIARVRERYGIPEGPYLLSLATLEPRRNIRHLVKCFATLLTDAHLSDLSLVLVGNKGWGLSDLLEAVERDPSARKKIVVTGYAHDEDLAPLYSGAMAFVYPSLCEGFGLTPLEAMQCGTPVITSNTSSIPEVVADAGIQIDPSDGDALCQSILAIYGSDNLRASLSARSLSRAEHFSWVKCVQGTIAAYKAALNGRN